LVAAGCATTSKIMCKKKKKKTVKLKISKYLLCDYSSKKKSYAALASAWLLLPFCKRNRLSKSQSQSQLLLRLWTPASKWGKSFVRFILDRLAVFLWNEIPEMFACDRQVNDWEIQAFLFKSKWVYNKLLTSFFSLTLGTYPKQFAKLLIVDCKNHYNKLIFANDQYSIFISMPVHLAEFRFPIFYSFLLE